MEFDVCALEESQEAVKLAGLLEALKLKGDLFVETKEAAGITDHGIEYRRSPGVRLSE
jgi:hypothetical protein